MGLGGDSVGLDHMLAAMFRVADQPPASQIDDKVKQLQRDLPDEHRAIVGYFRDFDDTVSPLYRETHRFVDPRRYYAGGGSGSACPVAP